MQRFNIFFKIKPYFLIFLFIVIYIHFLLNHTTLLNLLIICYFIVNIKSPLFSEYFRLSRLDRNNYLLEKTIIKSQLLFISNKPSDARKKLKDDLVFIVLPRFFNKVEKGDKLIIETHLFTEKEFIKIMQKEGFKISYEEIEKVWKIRWIPLIISMLLTNFFHLFTRKPMVQIKSIIKRKWYKITIEKL